MIFGSILIPSAEATAATDAASSFEIATWNHSGTTDEDDGITIDATIIISDDEINYADWYWTVMAVFLFLTACCCCYFVGSILSNRQVSSQGYNLYIVFLVIPDAMLTMVRGVALVTVKNLSNLSSQQSKADVWFLFFYFASNLTLNAVVSYEVHTMVHNSYNRKRTKPPSVKRVLFQVVPVYILAGGMATWALIVTIKWPTVFAFRVIPLCGSGSLMLYVFYVGFRIRKLLPRSGRTRALSLYFMRIIVVFVLCYIPGIMGLTILGFMGVREIVMDVMQNALFIMQALVTIYMAAQKDDVKEAMTKPYNSLRQSITTSNVATLRSSLVSWWSNKPENSSSTAFTQQQEPKKNSVIAAAAAEEVFAVVDVSSAEATHNNNKNGGSSSNVDHEANEGNGGGGGEEKDEEMAAAAAAAEEVATADQTRTRRTSSVSIWEAEDVYSDDDDVNSND